MNTRKKQINFAVIIVTAFVVLIAGCNFFGDNEQDQSITMEDLPVAVKLLAEKETEGCKIKEVEKEIHDGEIIYAITYDQDGTEMEIEYTPEGKLISKESE
jgi:uncharacterized membrane protein YkoI